MTTVRLWQPDPLLRFLWHGRRLAAVGAVLGLLLGGAYYLTRPPVYHATAVLALNQLYLATDLSADPSRDSVVSVDTQANLLHSDAVVAAVARATAATPSTVVARIGVTARPLTRVLEVTFTANDPVTAARGANVAAQELLEQRAQLFLLPQQLYLHRVLDGTRDPQLIPGAAGVTDATYRQEAWRERAWARAVGSNDPGSVLAEATPVAAPDRGDVEVPVASGTAFGAITFLLAGYAWSRRSALRRGAIRWA